MLALLHSLDISRRHTLVSSVSLAIVCLSLAIQVQWSLKTVILKLLPNGKVHDGQLVQEGRVALLRVEGPLSKTQSHHWTNLVSITAFTIMLLNDLEKPSVIDIAVLLQLLDLVGDAVELRLEGAQTRGRDLALVALILVAFNGSELLELIKGGFDTVLQGIEAMLLELGDLFELDVEDLLAEALLVVLGPGLGIIVGSVLVQEALELGVVNVLVLPWRVDGLSESLAEPHRRGSWSLSDGYGANVWMGDWRFGGAAREARFVVWNGDDDKVPVD